MTKFRVLCGMAVLLSATGAFAQPLVYSNNLDSTDASGFMKFQVTLGTGATPLLDSDAFFGFNFGAAYPWDSGVTYTGTAPLNTTIPPHPGTGVTRGLMLRANMTQIDNPAGSNNVSVETINVAPKLKLTGDYRIEVDTWGQVQSSGTSTQLGMIGSQHNLRSGWMQNWSGNGYSLGFVHDGSSGTDYRLFRGLTWDNPINIIGSSNPFYGATNTATGATSNQLNNTNAYYNTYMTVAGGYRYAGATASRWIRMIVTRTGDNLKVEFQNIDQTTGAPVGPALLVCNGDVTTPIVSATTGATVAATVQEDGAPWMGFFDPAASPRPVDYPLFSIFNNLKVYGTIKQDVMYGTFELGDWTGSYPASVVMRAYDSSDTQIGGDITAALRKNDTTGKQDYFIDLPAGTVAVRSRFNGGVTQKIEVGGSGPFQKNFVLKNGDCDRDDTVSILDYLAVSAYYEKDNSDPNWSVDDPNTGTTMEKTDLDGDNTISILDYIILSTNYEAAGE